MSWAIIVSGGSVLTAIDILSGSITGLFEIGPLSETIHFIELHEIQEQEALLFVGLSVFIRSMVMIAL